METGLSENLFAQMLKILIKGLIPVNLSISKDPVLLDLQVHMSFNLFKVRVIIQVSVKVNEKVNVKVNVKVNMRLRLTP